MNEPSTRNVLESRNVQVVTDLKASCNKFAHQLTIVVLALLVLIVSAVCWNKFGIGC